MTLQNAYDDFLLYQRSIGNSDKTNDCYKNCLQPFIKAFNADFDINCFDRSNLRKYAVSLRDRGLSSNSVKTYSKGIKVFLSWLYSDGYTGENFSNYYKLPKAQRKVIDVLTDKEIEILLGCFDTDTHMGLRNYCICCLMLGCGLRKNEIVSLNPDDVHLDSENPYIIVQGKGDKERFVPLDCELISKLWKYQILYVCSEFDVFFRTRSFNPIKAGTIERLFKTLKSKTGINRIRAHLLRHTFATRYLINGGNIYNLQSILGHTDLDMVKRYLHMSQSQVLHNFQEFSPLKGFIK